MKKIIIVEDEKIIRDELATILEHAGYEVSKILNFKNTTKQLLESLADLILLDLNLPNENGFRITRDIKNKSSIPILVLTSRGKIADEIKALELGADEYLTKPFRKERLLARIGNVLKRYEGRKNLLERDNFLLDRNTYTIYVGGKSKILSHNQGKLLESFLLSESGVVTKDELCILLWNTIEHIDENALHVNITRLKKTIYELGISYKIESVRRVGYKLSKIGKNDET